MHIFVSSKLKFSAMKKIFTLILFVSIFASNKNFSQTINDSCQTALPFCTGITLLYPGGTNGAPAQTGPDYGCLYTQPNPVWYYMQVTLPGNIDIEMHSVPSYDIDFICYGPFSSATAPCSGQLTAANTVDCSYSSSSTETCNMTNCQTGDYYLLMITNYSNQPCNIIYSQTNFGQIGAAEVSCSSVASLSGKFYLDINNNLTHDSIEPGFSNALVFAPSCGGYFMSQDSGNYNAYVCNLPDTIRPYFNYLTSFISPSYYEVTSSVMNNLDFRIPFIPGVYDVSNILTNVTPARPGFSFPCVITLQNLVTEQDCGNLSLTYDTLFNYISSSPQPDTIIGNTLFWNNVCVDFFQYYNFNIQFFLDSSVSLGTNYVFTTNFISSFNETNIVNNSDTIAGVVVGSYDPNDKEVTPEGEISYDAAANSQELEYTIRFQNTGTYAATTVRVVDTLSNWLNIPSFEFLSASHPCTYNITGQGIVEFKFNNINLPDHISNEAGSHGFVKFKANCKHELALGGNVYNTGNIFFDFNTPIITNTTNTFTKSVNTYIPNIKNNDSKKLNISPNPATNEISFNIDKSVKEELTTEIIDNLGRIVITKSIEKNKDSYSINVSSLQSGSYLIRIYGKTYSKQEVFIKN